MKIRHLSAVAVALALSTAVGAQTGDAGKPGTRGGPQAGMSASGTASSDDVRQVQQELQKRGFNVGTVNGVMGTQTKDAVKQFQQAEGLPATGELDQKTKDALKRGSARSSTPGSAKSSSGDEFSNPNAPSVHGSNTPGAASPASPGSAPRGGSAGSGVKGSPPPAAK
jgi:peptidoglycan hydrolase-like protein with peptidoglycan-binding domain